MNARGVDFTGMAYLIALAVGGYAVYRLVQSVPSVKKAVSDAAGTVLNAVNPTNPENVFNRAANAVTAAVTGDPSMTPGLFVERLFSGRKSTDGDALLRQFSALDHEDAELGAAMRRNALRGDPVFASAADRDDAELGAAMAAGSGAAFINYSKMRQGIIR